MALYMYKNVDNVDWCLMMDHDRDHKILFMYTSKSQDETIENDLPDQSSDCIDNFFLKKTNGWSHFEIFCLFIVGFVTAIKLFVVFI